MSEAMQAAREAAKPFYLRPLFMLKDYPVEPVPLLILLIGGYWILSILTDSPKAQASHILLSNASDKSKSTLEEVKAKIESSEEGVGVAFKACAGEISECPSGKSAGGYLGKFGRGAMVPAFDKAIFNPENKTGTVIGPIQTHFGWHLILIHKRRM